MEYNVNKLARKMTGNKKSVSAPFDEEEKKDDDSDNSVGLAAMSAAKTMSKGGGLADAAASGLMATKNPFAVGAALGLQTISGISKKKQEEEQLKYQNKVNALNNLSSFARGMSSL